MKIVLTLIFGAILCNMLYVVCIAGLQESLTQIPKEVTEDPWFQATLHDAYCGFITFYVWVAYRERFWITRIIWFVLIMGLGNIAMAAYMLFRVLRLPRDAKMSDLLLRKA